MAHLLALLLLLSLHFCARKSFAWIIAAALIIVVGSRIGAIFDFNSDWYEFLLAQLGGAVLMVVGSLLRRADASGWQLFYRARLYGTADFSHSELIKLLGFSALAKRTVINVSVIICLLTACAAMAVEFIESGSSYAGSTITLLDTTPPPGYETLDNSGMGKLPGEITADTPASSIASQTARMRDTSLKFPEVLLPVFLPLLIGLVVSQFLLRVQDSSWFRALPMTELKRYPVELPSFIWFFPALAILLAWSEKFFAFFAAF